MTAEQLDLFAEQPAQLAGPVYGVTVCWRCGGPVAAVPIDDPAEPWQPAVLFGYVALKAHERAAHPELAS